MKTPRRKNVLTVHLHIDGMEELINAVRGEISPEDEALLKKLDARALKIAKKLEKLDRKT